MNYLAHLYLSGDDEETIVGNFIGDDVKGKSFEKYPEKIRKGILLHRHIDSFTDGHFQFREAKKLMAAEYGLYAGIVTDLFYDHLLAVHWNFYSEYTLRTFAKRIHAVLLSHFFHLPHRVKSFLPFLIQNRRLESYASASGIQQSLEIMSRYTSLPEKSEKAVEIMKQNYPFLEKNFSVFMNDIIGFVESEFGIVIKKPVPGVIF
jgi:acyl carrier protein phosphodiesterase